MILSKLQTIHFITILLILCTGCDEVKEKHFDDFAAAQHEHMVEKGWMPTFISPDARNINIVGDLDTASVNGSYISANTALLREHCLRAGDSFKVQGYGPKWFSDDIKEAGTAAKLRLKGYDVLSCKDGFNVAILSSRQYVSYWFERK